MITIDSREGTKTIEDVKNYFESRGVPVQVGTIVYGDYIIESGGTRIVIERKTPDDFINSSKVTVAHPTSRLTKQLNRCLESGDKVVLLIDGNWVPTKTGIKTTRNQSLPAESIISRLRTISEHGVRIEHCPSHWFLPRHLYNIYKYYQSSHDSMDVEPKTFSIRAQDYDKHMLLVGIRGMGVKSAKALMLHFGTIEALCQASVKELQQVKGVGPKTAEEVYRMLH